MRSLVLLLAVLLLAACAEKGADETSSGPSGPATWADVQAVFSANSCTGCHPALSPPTLDYATLTTAFGLCTANGGKYVEPGDRTLSCLYLVITGADGPAMGAAPYSAAVTDPIGSWIDAGANP